MACNTAHLFQEQLEQALQHKINSLIDMTITEILNRDVKKLVSLHLQLLLEAAYTQNPYRPQEYPLFRHQRRNKLRLRD